MSAAGLASAAASSAENTAGEAGETLVDDRIEQPATAAKVIVDHRRRDTGARRDPGGCRRGDALLGEERHGSVEERFAGADLGGQRRPPARAAQRGLLFHPRIINSYLINCKSVGRAAPCLSSGGLPAASARARAPARSTIIGLVQKNLVALVFGVLAACAEQPLAPRSGAVAPPGFPDAYYRQASAQGKQVMRIESASSLVAIEVLSRRLARAPRARTT
jgi:hypothetical protein